MKQDIFRTIRKKNITIAVDVLDNKDPIPSIQHPV